MMGRFCWLLDGDVALSWLRIPRRFLATLVFIAIVKFFLTALVSALGSGFWMDPMLVKTLPQNQILLADGAAEWVYTFLGWDSAWYASIAAFGYQFSGQSYAFPPGVPLLTQLLQPFFGNILIALVVCSFITGLLWVPVYQSVAEHYLSRDMALISTLLFSLSPFTLLFTTVAYSEGPFLLTTLVVWKLYLDKRYAFASLAGAAAALIRVPGFLITLPMFLGLLFSVERGERRRAVLVVLPTLVALLIWVGYMTLTTGDPLALIHTTEWSTNYNLLTYLLTIIPGGVAALSFPGTGLALHWLLPLTIWISILIPPVLMMRVASFDKTLAFYSAAYIASIFAFGGLVSYPRFMTVLFPLWLPLSAFITKTKWVTPIFIATSVVMCLVLWLGFVNGVFVG